MIVFELTDEQKAQLQQMVDAGVQVTVDSVREHCKVSLSRATRMARKWKEFHKQQRKVQAEAAAKVAAERWEKMDKEQKERAQQAALDGNGKEEKAEATVDGKREGEEAGGEKDTEKRRKERVKAPIVPAEDAKKMKKIESFFSKATTPQYAVASSSSSSSSSSSCGSPSTGSSAPKPGSFSTAHSTAAAAGGGVDTRCEKENCTCADQLTHSHRYQQPWHRYFNRSRSTYRRCRRLESS